MPDFVDRKSIYGGASGFLRYLVIGILLAIAISLGAGFGSVLYSPKDGFFYAHGLPPGGPWSQIVGYGIFGVLMFWPAEVVLVLACAFAGGSLSWFRIRRGT